MTAFRPETTIEMLRRHCAMYLYGSQAPRSPLLSPVADSFVSFAGMHLMCTMFITTDASGGPEGVFHRVLDPPGHGHLLAQVDRVLSMPVGATTVRDYLRSKRNKMAVHGALHWHSQPAEVQEVVSDETALEQFEEAMAELDRAVEELDRALAALQEESRG